MAEPQHFSPGACAATGLTFDGTDDFVMLRPPEAIDEDGDVTIAIRANYRSIEANYERIFDFDTGACGSKSFFADVYTNMRMTLQVYDCGNLVIDDFWKVGDNQFHTYVFVVGTRGMQAYRDGVSLGTSTDCQGVPEQVRTAMYIGGSSCGDADVVHKSAMELQWVALFNRALNDDEVDKLDRENNQGAHRFFQFAGCEDGKAIHNSGQ
jgi:hypothetical protein